MVAKTDYAANGGTYSPTESSTLGGPGWSQGPAVGCATTYPSGCNWGEYNDPNDVVKWFDGVVRPRFPVELRQISDGTTNTLMAVEKYLRYDLYSAGDVSVSTCTDNNSLYQGFDWDVVRWARFGRGLAKDYTPHPDSYHDPDLCHVRFGSAHPSVFYAVFCDGSVRSLSYDIELVALERMARRNDGEVVK
jgi:hypothetical protein